MGRKLLVALAAAASLPAAVATSPALAGGSAGFGPVDPAAPNTERVNQAYWLIAGLSMGILLIVCVPLVVFVVRYRSGGRPRHQDGAQVHGNTAFELAWTAVPVLIITGIAAFVFYKLPGITDPAAAGEKLEVRVEGRQFYWRFVYPNGTVAVDTLRVPVGRVVELDMTAPDRDVIHSFWIPALFGKRDTIPGQHTTVRFVAERTGTFEGQCGEFCGIQHAMMLTRAEVVEPDAFDSWLSQEARTQATGGRELGRSLWEGVCMKCHRLDETYVGPPLRGNPRLANRQQLAQIVRNGRRTMPAVGEGWTDREVAALHLFVRGFARGGQNQPQGGAGNGG